MSKNEVFPRLSVVIVTWNCAGLLIQCLTSLDQHAGNLDYELIVVDNASSDTTLTVLAQLRPTARVIANTENHGFAVACNQGMSVASAPLLFLLNPDTLLTQANTLERLCERMNAYPQIAMAGIRLVFPDGRYQVGDAGHCPTLSAVIAHALFLSRLNQHLFPGLMLLDGTVQPPYGRVDWVCGGCTIVRKSSLAVAGAMDESFFMYGEDIEWGCRYTHAGLLVAYFPDIQLVHLQGGTQKGNDPNAPPPVRWIDGMACLFQRYNAGKGFWAFRASLALGFLFRSTIYRAAEVLGLSRSPIRRSRVMLIYARHVWDLRESLTGQTPKARDS